MRPSFKVGESFITRKQPIRQIPERRVITSVQAPAFKATAPRPRNFLGQEAFEAKELKEKGVKVDLGTVKTRVPVLDDRGNPIRDAEGKPVTKEKEVKIGDIGGTVLEKFESLKEILSGLKGSIEDNQAELAANLAGILKTEEIDDLPPDKKELVSQAIEKIRVNVEGELADLGNKGLLQRGRFLTSFGEDKANRALLTTLVSKLVTDHKGAVDLFGKELNIDSPVIGVSGRRIKFGPSFNMKREWVLDLLATDDEGKSAPRIFPNLKTAEQAAERFEKQKEEVLD
jgi:hypothetical protein